MIVKVSTTLGNLMCVFEGGPLCICSYIIICHSNLDPMFPQLAVPKCSTYVYVLCILYIAANITRILCYYDTHFKISGDDLGFMVPQS